MTRLILADHLLKDRSGHHLGYNLVLAEAAASLGWKVTLMTARGFESRLASPHECARVFRPDWRAAPHRMLSGSRQALSLLETLSRHRFQKDLDRGMSDIALGSGDMVFAQMLGPRHLAAWLNWAVASNTQATLVCHLGYEPSKFWNNADFQKAWTAFLHSQARLRLISDSEALAGEYQKLLGRAVHVLPHVISTRILSQSNTVPKPPIHFVSFGNAREEKGFNDILAAVALLQTELEEGKIHITLQAHQAEYSCTEAMLRAEGLRGVTLLRNGLEDVAYLDLLASAHVVLVPYHLKTYALRTSGVFCEAVAAGKPVIATKGSWMETQAQGSGSCVCVLEKSPQSLAAAIRDASAGIEELTREAHSRAGDYRGRFSAVPFLLKLHEVCSK